MAHVKSDLKQDTVAALRQALLDLPTLFLDSLLKKAENDIGRFEDKGQSHGQAGGRSDDRFDPYKRLDRQPQEQYLASQLGNNWVILTTREREVVDSLNKFSSRPGRAQQ